MKYVEMNANTLCTQACLALALLYSVRRLEHECKVNGVDLCDMSDIIMLHMHTNLQEGLSCCSDTESEQYQKAHLWTAMIGTI